MLVLALVGAGCGGAGGASDEAPPRAAETATTEGGPATASRLNEVELGFLARTVDRHRQIIAVARSVPTKTQRNELADLAARMVTVREQEVSSARDLLSEADRAVRVSPSAAASDGGEPEGLEALGGMRGDEFDRRFIDTMISTDQVTIEAAERAIDEGKHPQVAQLATKVISTRQAEVGELQVLQQRWWPPLAPATPAGLGPGDRGLPVLALEQRLEALHYHVGQVDGVFDVDTGFGVVAFQKVAGLPRSGRATPDVIQRLDSAEFPEALAPDGGGERVEVDLTRQVLLLYQQGDLFKILPVSSGTGERFCAEGGCGRAVTPAGSYRRSWHDDGWRESRLGRLYNPVYVIDRLGIAIHGHPRVPPEPASHGCIRIPMSAAEWFPDVVPRGTPVYISDGTTPLGPPPAQPGVG
ncbi:MAG TPA: DUF305 domain-containing protein [Nitriliruptorales bacterium]|nr:DUF305 domain-containing protein [Nitriliruptorales bacterium]